MTRPNGRPRGPKKKPIAERFWTKVNRDGPVIRVELGPCEPGDKFDTEKPRWDLLPVGPVRSVVDVLTYGAKKYTPDGWMKVADPQRRYYAAALRHLTAWYEGERVDPESKLPHLAHAACSILFLLGFEGRR